MTQYSKCICCSSAALHQPAHTCEGLTTYSMSRPAVASAGTLARLGSCWHTQRTVSGMAWAASASADTAVLKPFKGRAGLPTSSTVCLVTVTGAPLGDTCSCVGAGWLRGPGWKRSQSTPLGMSRAWQRGRAAV
jgi:hypothetical protein